MNHCIEKFANDIKLIVRMKTNNLVMTKKIERFIFSEAKKQIDVEFQVSITFPKFNVIIIIFFPRTSKVTWLTEKDIEEEAKNQV